MIFPEIEIDKILRGLLQYIVDDYNNSSFEEDSFLYQIFKDANFGDTYNIFEQAKELFLRETKSPDKIAINLMLPREVSPVPSIHIVIPSEAEGVYNTLGYGVGNANNIERQDNKVQSFLERTFKSDYQLVITSTNNIEAIIMYRTVLAGLIAIKDSFLHAGFDLQNITGADLVLNQNTAPNLYGKTINLSLDYTVSVPSVVLADNITNIVFLKADIVGPNRQPDN